MEYRYKVNGTDYAVNITSIKGNKAQVLVNGVVYDVEVENGEAMEAAAVVVPVEKPVAEPQEQPAPAPAPQTETKKEAAVAAEAPKASPANVPAGGAPVKSPLPGIINDIKVSVGDQVKNGQTLLILEAMKMANEITAEQDGVISAIAVSKGDSVMEGAVLLTIA